MKLAKNYFSIPGLQNCLRLNFSSKAEKQNASGNSTVDYQDVEHLSKLSSTWWDLNGPIRLLHSFNSLRIEFIRKGLISTGFMESNPHWPLEGVKLLDVGCGGGILSEALAKVGAQVTGIDPSEDLLTIAKKHAALDHNITSNIKYENITIEDFCLKNKEQYDAVVASEVLEHVNNPKLFLKNCSEVLKPNGSIFITTQNRNLLSFLGGIILAEYVLELIPKGTHDWNKFRKPEETEQWLHECNCETKVVRGVIYNLAKNDFDWFFSTAISYALHAVKQRS